MRIIVAIKQILDPEGITVNRRRERIFTDGAELIVNAADKCALEAALGLKDSLGAEVVAISIGSETADDALREAMAIGADLAYLLSDEALMNVDATGAARALARAIEQIGTYDLLLTGQAAADTGGEEVPGRLAEMLGIPQVLEALEVKPDAGGLVIQRKWNGKTIRVRVPLPALVAILPEAAPARFPHGVRIMNAYREWEVVKWTSHDLQLSEEELTPTVESRGQVFPPPREMGTLIRGAPQQIAQDVLSQLKAQRMI